MKIQSDLFTLKVHRRLGGINSGMPNTPAGLSCAAARPQSDACWFTSGFPVLGQEKTSGKERQTMNQLLARKLTAADGSVPAVKVSISSEGMEACRRMIAEKGWQAALPDLDEIKNSTILMGQVYGSFTTSTRYFATEEEVTEGKDMTDTIVPLWFSQEVSNLKEAQGGNTWRDKASRLAQAYASLYDEIVAGYENGTRVVRVTEKEATVSDLAQGRGYRVLTMEEELAELDRVYEKHVKELEEHVKNWPKQFEIFRRMDESRSKMMGREPVYTEERVRELEEDYKTVPDDLAQRMLSVRNYWKVCRANMSGDRAWKSVAEIINTMFRSRESSHTL